MIRNRHSMAALSAALLLLVVGISGCSAFSSSTSSSKPPPTMAQTTSAATAVGSSTSASVVAGTPTAGGDTACRNLAASPAVKSAVTAAHSRYAHLMHIEPVPGDFYYGMCGTTQYAATDFQAGPGAGQAEGVGLQDDGAAMQYFARSAGGDWQHVSSDGFPRDPRGCAAVAQIPSQLAATWRGCPSQRSSQVPRTYLASGGWNARFPVFEPSSVILSGDSTLGLQAMRWPTWTADTAIGLGTGWSDNCQPVCARGTISRQPVQIVLRGTASTCGSQFFTSLEIDWTATVPQGWARRSVWRSGIPAC